MTVRVFVAEYVHDPSAAHLLATAILQGVAVDAYSKCWNVNDNEIVLIVILIEFDALTAVDVSSKLFANSLNN